MVDSPNVAFLNKYPKLIGIADRLALTVVTYAAAKGWIHAADIPIIGDYLGEILGGGLAVAVGIYQNRKAALAEAATTISPGTTVVTTADVAKATPDNSNIVSNTENKVVDKK